VYKRSNIILKCNCVVYNYQMFQICDAPCIFITHNIIRTIRAFTSGTYNIWSCVHIILYKPYYTVRVSDGFLIRISAAHNNEPQMWDRDSETLRRTCNITSPYFTAVCFYIIIIIVAVVISKRAPRPPMSDGGGRGGSGVACQEINPIQDYDNENIAARRMSPNTLRAHVSGDNTPSRPPNLWGYSKTISPQVNTHNSSRGEDFYKCIIRVMTAGASASSHNNNNNILYHNYAHRCQPRPLRNGHRHNILLNIFYNTYYLGWITEHDHPNWFLYINEFIQILNIGILKFCCRLFFDIGIP